MLKFESVIEDLIRSFRYALEYSERLDCESWVQYNPNTGSATYTGSVVIAEARRKRGYVDIGRYVSGKLVALE